MSTFEDCKSWPSFCKDFTCYEDDNPRVGSCFSTTENRGPIVYTHNINTDYGISVAGFNIPVVKTNRSFTASETWDYSIPTSINGVWMWDNGTYWCFDGFTTEQRTFRMEEDCTITKSTLAYLDLENKVCLYRKNIETFKFDVSSSHTNLFKNPWWTRRVASIRLYVGNKKNWTSESIEEWHLIVNGQDRLLTSSVYDPTGDLTSLAYDGSGDLFDDSYSDKADPELALIIHISPPTASDEIAWDDELRYHGYYSFRGGVNSLYHQIDGGCNDYYYPGWCRGLQEDPFWKQAAADRYSITTLGQKFESSISYTPPPVTADPIPRGTYAKHPQVGEVYQFLVEKRDGGYHLETSPNVNDIINNAVPEAERKTGTTLYYPIGVL